MSSTIVQNIHNYFNRLSPVAQGAVFILVGEALLAIMGAIIKHLSSTIASAPSGNALSSEQIVFFRNLMGLAVLLVMLLPTFKKSGLSSLKTQRIGFHLIRSLVGVSAMYCYFIVLAKMPLAEAFLVKLTGPLFMPIIAYLWLKEGIGRHTYWAIIVGFIGVMFILRPGSEQFSIFALIGLLGALLAALAKVTIRRMQHETSSSIVFYFGLIATLISAPFAFLNWQPVPIQAWAWLLLLGLVGTFGQLALTRAYRTAPTGKVGIYVYSSVIYGVVLGFIFWAEIPLWSTLLGSALIIAAGMINLKSNLKK